MVADKGTLSRRVAALNGAESAGSAAKLGTADHAYCIILALYALVNWYVLYRINHVATGLTSVTTIVWSFMSLIVLILAVVQFWNIKSGRLVTLSRKAAPR
jgi:hypothetical protein